MTTESTLPQPEMGPAPANGQGQSQGHRRRRRRRKNKSQAAGTAQGVQNPQGTPQAQAPPPPKIQQSPPFQNQGGSQGGGQGHSRKKKKFFEKRQPGYQQPTIAAPVREDAPTKIFCFIDDLFFQAKINETSKKLGVKVEFLKGDKDSIAKLTDAPEEERPTLVVFDLNNLNAKPMTLIPKFKAKFKKATSIVGFLNHLQGDLKIKAIEAGCDTVMPRSAFSQSLPNLLRRYGLEEEEDHYPQPV
jgi:hypothetical protein